MVPKDEWPGSGRYRWIHDDEVRGKRTFRRLLANRELFFYNDNLKGIADTMIQIDLSLMNRQTSSSRDAGLIDDKRIRAAWSRCRSIHPLLAARIEPNRGNPLDGQDHLAWFVIGEDAPADPGCLPHDCIEIRRLADVEEAARTHRAHFVAPETRILHPSLLSKLLVLLPDARDATQDRGTVFIMAAHSISDASALRQMARTFLEFLVAEDVGPIDGLSTEAAVVRVPAAQELVRWQSKEPTWRSIARERWQWLYHRVLVGIRGRKGGHTFPQRPGYSRNAPQLTRTHHVTIPRDVSQRILAACKQHGITWGNAAIVLAWLSFLRIIVRRRQSFDIEEWEYRKAQPCHFPPPVSLVPFFDADPGDALGRVALGRVLASFAFAAMPLPPLSDLGVDTETGESVTITALLSRERFFLQARSVRRHLTGILRRPRRFLSVFIAMELARLRNHGDRAKGEEGVKAPVLDGRFEFVGGISSTGPVEKQLPLLYPTPSSLAPSETQSPPLRDEPAAAPTSSLSSIISDTTTTTTTGEASPTFQPTSPRLEIVDVRTFLRARQTERLFITDSFKGQLRLTCHFDAASFDPEVIKEYVDGVSEGARLFLDPAGRSHEN